MKIYPNCAKEILKEDLVIKSCGRHLLTNTFEN
jgi:hypothetical protein